MESPKILVAGICDLTVALARKTFEPLGYQIITARPMSVALFLAQKNLPDLIISSFEMLDGDGLTFLRELKGDEELAVLPFVFSTQGKPEATLELAAIKEGARKVLATDFSPSDFLSLLEPLIRERLSQKGNRQEHTPE